MHGTINCVLGIMLFCLPYYRSLKNLCKGSAFLIWKALFALIQDGLQRLINHSPTHYSSVLTYESLAQLAILNNCTSCSGLCSQHWYACSFCAVSALTLSDDVWGFSYCSWFTREIQSYLYCKVPLTRSQKC